MFRALLAAALIFFVSVPSFAADLDPLLQILIKKGILTEEEARQVQEEAAALKAQEKLQLTDQVKKEVAAAPEAKPAVPVKFDFGKGVTFGKPGDHSLTLTGYFQAQYEAGGPQANWSFFPTARDKDEDSFLIRRARMIFTGSAFPKFDYLLQLDLTQSNIIKDARITWNPKENRFRVNMGQFQAPYSREELVPPGLMTFVGHSLVNSFVPARDLGVMMDGRVWDKKIYWAAGAFNGAGENTLNDNNGLLYTGRLQFDPLGEFRLGMTDLDRSAKPLVAVALQYATSNDSTDKFPRTIKGEKDMWGLDFAWKWKGLYTEAEWLRAEYDPTDPTVEPFDMTAWRAQVGYMATKRFEVAVRWAESYGDENPYFVENRGGTPAWKPTIEREQIGTLGLGWFVNGHANKIQADYSWVWEDYYDPDLRDIDDNVFRVMYQIWF